MFTQLDSWDIALLAMAAYLATVSLARLMIGWRNQYLEQLSNELNQSSGSQAPASEAPRKAA